MHVDLRIEVMVSLAIRCTAATDWPSADLYVNHLEECRPGSVCENGFWLNFRELHTLRDG
ncbi:hypothetical protein ASE03_23830 [Kitasatospora sp. Root187]|nr:hypothetical protein ASC99_27705 [Kitasatospora sp. Root107]KRB71597.1 hypothetical protein ASE03_23830 [Kitasatospora sp. Root187]